MLVADQSTYDKTGIQTLNLDSSKIQSYDGHLLKPAMSIVGEIEFAHGYDVGRGPACPDETCYLLPVVLKDIGDPGRSAVLKPAISVQNI